MVKCQLALNESVSFLARRSECLLTRHSVGAAFIINDGDLLLRMIKVALFVETRGHTYVSFVPDPLPATILGVGADWSGVGSQAFDKSLPVFNHPAQVRDAATRLAIIVIETISYII